MKLLPLTILGLLTIAMSLEDKVTFDNESPGPMPPHWVGTQTGEGKAIWTLEKADDAPSKPIVLKQSGQATFPLCYKEDSYFLNGWVSVKFKPESGTEDQAGGLVWRLQDENNYYVARANALEDNVTIYHTLGGNRVSFKTVKTKVASGVWHTLRVDYKGNQFTVTFDGQKVIEATDDSIKKGGKIGVWTKADSVTLFDDFAYDGIPDEPKR